MTWVYFFLEELSLDMAIFFLEPLSPDLGIFFLKELSIDLDIFYSGIFDPLTPPEWMLGHVSTQTYISFLFKHTCIMSELRLNYVLTWVYFTLGYLTH